MSGTAGLILAELSVKVLNVDYGAPLYRIIFTLVSHGIDSLSAYLHSYKTSKHFTIKYMLYLIPNEKKKIIKLRIILKHLNYESFYIK